MYTPIRISVKSSLRLSRSGVLSICTEYQGQYIKVDVSDSIYRDTSCSPCPGSTVKSFRHHSPLVDTFVVYCKHVTPYIWRSLHSKHMYNNLQCTKWYFCCGLHLELNFTICLLYLKASHQSGFNRCWCMSRHICGAHCLSLKFDALHNMTSSGANSINNSGSHYTHSPFPLRIDT